MAKRSKMSDVELSALLDGQIADAVAYDESELAEHREQALEYIEGEMRDTPAEEGKSSVVSYDVRDTMAWILPGIMRVFLASDRVAIYEPEKPNDEPFAAQATDLVNYIFLKECSGYKVLFETLYDGLALGNGILKHWWDDTPEHKVERFSNLSDDAFTALVAPDDVEVLEHSERPAVAVMPEEAAMLSPDAPAPTTHDVKIKRLASKGRIVVEALPPEDFLIERAATALDEKVRFVAHISTPTRSDLIKQGYERDIVEALPTHYVETEEDADDARDHLNQRTGTDDADKSVEKVKIYECYVLVDTDGDGIAERRMVVMGDKGGRRGERKILKNEEWGDDLPFTDLVPDPVAHRWRGRSLFDKLHDIQRIKTVLSRQTLDNLYRVNNPQRVALEGAVENMDALVNNEIGEVIRVNRPDAIQDLTVPFVAEKTFGALAYFDEVIAKRTGVSASSMGLDPETLQNQTAQAVAQQQSSSQSMVELYARNIAEVGLRRLFRCLLRLLVKHQDKTRAIRLRDEWVEMDPQAWNADMDATVNVGLGAGSRDRDMAMLRFVMEIQEKIFMAMGPSNPLVGLSEIRNAFAKAIEAAGMRAPEQFVREFGKDEEQQMMQAKAQQPPPPDPKMLEMQAKQQLEQQKAQADVQMQQQRGQVDVQLAMQKQEADAALAMRKLDMEFQGRQQQMQAEAQLRREQMVAEIQLKREQMQAEIAMKRELGVYSTDAQTAATVSKTEMGGNVG